MRLALTALVLVFLTACGNSSDVPKDTKPSETSTSEADALDDTCAKLGRTWAVAADGLGISLALAAMESVGSAMDAMTAATDQMKIEQCQGEIVSLTAEGSLYAAYGSAEALGCSREAEMKVCPAGETWRSEGEPIVAKVEILSMR